VTKSGDFLILLGPGPGYVQTKAVDRDPSKAICETKKVASDADPIVQRNNTQMKPYNVPCNPWGTIATHGKTAAFAVKS